MSVNNQQNIQPICLWHFTPKRHVQGPISQAIPLLPKGIIEIIVQHCQTLNGYMNDQFRAEQERAGLLFLPRKEEQEDELQKQCPYLPGKRKIETHVVFEIPYRRGPNSLFFSPKEFLEQFGQNQGWEKIYPEQDDMGVAEPGCYMMPFVPVPNVLRLNLLDFVDQTSNQKLGHIPRLVHLIFAMIVINHRINKEDAEQFANRAHVFLALSWSFGSPNLWEAGVINDTPFLARIDCSEKWPSLPLGQLPGYFDGSKNDPAIAPMHVLAKL